MVWEFIKAVREIKPRTTPEFEHQKTIWNDAAKIEAKVKEIVADELRVDISLVTPQADW